MFRQRKHLAISLVHCLCLSSLLYLHLFAWAQHDERTEVSILLEQVNSKDRSASNAAISALEGIDQEALTKSLPDLSKATRHKDKFVRRITVWLLRKVSRDAAPKAILELEKVLKDRDALVRASAADSLGRLGQTLPRESVQALTSALRDEDLYVRSSAVDALREIGPPAVEAVPALIAAAQDTNWLIRLAAFKALGKIGRGAAGKEIVPVLRKALNEENAVVRVASIEALGEIGVQAENAVADLTKSLQDSQKFVRSAAMTTLGRLAREGITDAKRAIESALQSPIEETRSLAANVFWRMGVPVKNAVPQLLRLLNEELAETRRGAARTLGTLRPASSDVIDALKLALKKDGDASVRAVSANSLANFGNAARSAIPDIREALRDSDPEVRRFAVLAAGNLRAEDGETLTLIKTLLEDKIESVRQQAVWAVVSLGMTPPSFVPTLNRLLLDRAMEIRRGAAVGLGRMGPAANGAVPNLILLLKDSNEQVRLGAVNALGSIGPTAGEAIPTLSRIVIDEREKPNIREAGAEALGHMGPGAKPALPSLELAMKSENEQVRSASVRAFARIGTPSEILPVLTNDLKSADVFVRLTALQGFSAMGPNAKDAVPDLIECLKDEDEQVRHGAANALGTMGHYAKDAISALTQAVQEGPNRNGSAVEALSRIAVAAQDKGATELVPELEAALAKISNFNEFKAQTETVRRAVDDLKRAASLAADPRRKLLEFAKWGVVGAAVFNFLLILLVIPFPWARRVIFHPVGIVALRLVVGKYLVTDFLFRFVQPVRMALFQNYRQNFARAPLLKWWETHLYIPQHLELPGFKLESNEEEKEEWKTVFDALLSQPTGRLWLLLGKSGLGKTALLEKWVYQSLKQRETPIFIPLGGDLSPSDEARAVMEQYGDINVKADTALDFLKAGRFIILLDGFNEDRKPAVTREFARQLVKRNHVIMSSQIDPKWEKFLETSNIVLKPFGREQLLKLMERHWVDELLAADYLSDLTELPHTAQLLANYIKENNRLPHLRLDIYRTLRKNLENDTQILNLEETAWSLFKENRKIFTPDNSVPAPLCELAMKDGILTKAEDGYQFRHELIHRFFVVCYLERQNRRPLEEWYEDVHVGLGRGYWSDALELWSELYAEPASVNQHAKETYYQFLKEAANFSSQIFAERLYPQLQRLYRTGALEKDAQIIEWAASLMAPAAARFQE